MKDGSRKAFRIAGLVLIAAAICGIGYAAYNLISADINETISLAEAEEEIKNSPDEVRQMLQDMNAYTGSPDMNQLTDSAQPEATGSMYTGPDDTYIPVTQNPMVVLPTSKPKSGSGSGTHTKPAYTGILVFDSLGKRKVPVLEGADESNLGRGAVHHSRSSPPGSAGNCVIYGHRNTVFRGFGGLRTGDIIRLEAHEETLTYKIQSMSVVEPGDPVIFKAYSQKIMTLVTCYPFHYVGAAPKRYIVVCVLQ